MKKSLFISAALVAAIVAYANTQDATVLRFTLPEKSEQTYAVTIKSNQEVDVPQMGPQKMGFDMDYNYKLKFGTVDAAKGQANVEFLTTDIKMTATGPMADMGGDQVPKQMSATGKLDNRYRLTEYKSKDANVQMMMATMGTSSMMQFFVEFPEAAVKSGETWDIVLPEMPITGTKDKITLKGSFHGEATVDGVTGYKVVMTGEVPLNMDLGKMLEEASKNNPNADPSGGMMAGMKILLKGKMKMNTVGIVDKTSGKLLKATSTIGTIATTELPDMGMSMATNGTMEIKASLK